MKVQVSEIKYPVESENTPTEFTFEINEEICKNDDSLSTEIFKLVKEKTGQTLTECTVDLD